MKKLFDQFRCENVKYVCHYVDGVRSNIKDGPRPYQEYARLYREFYFKIEHHTELYKITFMKSINLAHMNSINEKIYKTYLSIRNKELIN